MILCVGSVAYDVIELPGREPVEVLGGSATWFCTAASIFTRPSIVAVVGDDFREEDRAFLEHRGVDLRGLKRSPGTTFRWHGRYHDDLKGRDSLETHVGVFADFTPVIPPELRKPDYCFLGTIAPDLQSLVLAQVQAPRLVALDTIELWMEPPHLDGLIKLLPRAHVVFLNDEEVLLLAKRRNVISAARQILDFGVRALVVKRGEHGAMLFWNGPCGLEVRLYPAFPVESVVDPTGAGDSFAGGVLGYLDFAYGPKLEEGAIIRALQEALPVGTVVASFNVEGFGPRHYDRVSVRDVVNRLKLYSEMVSFDARLVVERLSALTGS